MRPASIPDTPIPVRHRAYEDLQALVTGSLVAALGVVLFKAAGLLPGGTMGLALLLHYTTGWELALALLVANAPFYLLACLRMGREFTVKTLLAVGMTSLFIWLLPQGLSLGTVNPLAGAVLGGLLVGMGILVLFRHHASLGGLNVLALYLQERFGWKPGLVQMGLDALIVVGGGLWATDATRMACSILAVVVLNLVLAINHRPDRYRAILGS
ncbi:YitT family protein [Ramlibacter albus]|uniref:YitT family protein n=1 Tax=Ramlibacter albus TaxID=2079448 RepID=A0A923MB37_9BURK|nr:YitT family protein [Ramlibacter albus]MBC5767370.1 YitT family protein [Ramlibacter albus]